MSDFNLQNHIIDQIRELIHLENLQTGDKLPSEINLARRFGVSRASVREAIRQMQSRGQVEVRPRSGCYVRSVADDPVGPPLHEMLSFDHNKMWELLEVRKHVEAGAAGLAAVRRSEAQLREFREILEFLDAAHRDNRLDEDVEKAYGRFFKNLSSTSNNTLFTHIMDSIGDLSRSALPFSRIKLQQLPHSREVILRQLHEIADAIIAMDAERARSAVLEHIEFVEKSLRDVLGYQDLNLLAREDLSE